MSKDLDNKYFIILNKDKIIFSCLNNQNKISFSKKHILVDKSNDIYVELDKFFINNLINIEKSLKDFIRKIYVIIDMDNSLTVNLSIKYNLETESISRKKINDQLNYLKYQFTKHTNDQKIIHMLISKSLIDGKEKKLLFINENFKNLILEVRFECLKNRTINIIKKIFLNYQISVEKLLIANYLREFAQNDSENIVYLANKINSGDNINEILWDSKKEDKKGFFEKFFDFFN